MLHIHQSDNFYTRLSKTISHALRHAPWQYELELDDQGWVLTEQLLSTLREMRPKWFKLEQAHLEELMRRSAKQRFEIDGDRIRACYGHSVPNKLSRESGTPPAILYHGTPPEVAKVILRDGLKPMNRQYVHLSMDIDTALDVGRRRATKPSLLVIDTVAAIEAGHAFYFGNDKVWLCDSLPAEFISQHFVKSR